MRPLNISPICFIDRQSKYFVCLRSSISLIEFHSIHIVSSLFSIVFIAFHLFFQAFQKLIRSFLPSSLDTCALYFIRRFCVKPCVLWINLLQGVRRQHRIQRRHQQHHESHQMQKITWFRTKANMDWFIYTMTVAARRCPTS